MAEKDHSTAQNRAGEKQTETMAQRLARIQSEPKVPRKQQSLPNLGASTPTSYGKLRERSSTSSLSSKFKKSGLIACVLGEPEYPITREGEENLSARPVIGEFLQVPSKFNMGSVASLASSFTEGSDRELKPHTMLVTKAFMSYEKVNGKFEPFYNISGYWVRSFSGKSSGTDEDPAGFEKHKYMCLLNVEAERILVPSTYAPPTTNPTFKPPLNCTYVAEKAAWINISCEATVCLPKDKFVKRFKPPGRLAPGEFVRLEQYRSSLPAMEEEMKARLEYMRWMTVPVGSFVTGQSVGLSSCDIWEDERAFAKLLEESRADPEVRRHELEDRVMRWMEAITLD